MSGTHDAIINGNADWDEWVNRPVDCQRCNDSGWVRMDNQPTPCTCEAGQAKAPTRDILKPPTVRTHIPIMPSDD